MAPTLVPSTATSALRGLAVPRSPNAAMMTAAKQTISQAAPRVLRAAGPAIVFRRASLELTSDAQKITVGVFCGYFLAIVILWYFPVRFVRAILKPFKLQAVAFHELGHAVACKLTCGRVHHITLDINEGGATQMSGGLGIVTYPAGYLGSSLVGSLMIFCGFDIVASKVASLVIGVLFLLLLWWGVVKAMNVPLKDGEKRWIAPLIILLNTGLLVACWFIADSEALRYYVLFVGTLTATYSVWDIFDDCIRRDVEGSDSHQMAKNARESGFCMCFCVSNGRVLGIIWWFISLGLIVAAIICGILAFPESEATQRQNSDDFIDATSR
ncbi:peptidase M50B-like-domain-containing protein [Coniella lustricola]|uniref:Peptidase M50B-like-domain-containing protein n=1 Tax=Coniella lustricola TaxID=2025994 RepID=A0A2T3AB64_9PEZI|nr:peptidase M50B-like-domain-containing protein [Coniella lustricola]